MFVNLEKTNCVMGQAWSLYLNTRFSWWLGKKLHDLFKYAFQLVLSFRRVQRIEFRRGRDGFGTKHSFGKCYICLLLHGPLFMTKFPTVPLGNIFLFNPNSIRVKCRLIVWGGGNTPSVITSLLVKSLFWIEPLGICHD